MFFCNHYIIKFVIPAVFTLSHLAHGPPPRPQTHSEAHHHVLVSCERQTEKDKGLSAPRALSRCFLEITKTAPLYSWSAVKYSP